MDKTHVGQEDLNTISWFLTEFDCTHFIIQDTNIFLQELWESEHVFTRSLFIFFQNLLTGIIFPSST